MISLKTVRNHVSNIYSKLQVVDRAQAVIKAQKDVAKLAAQAAELKKRKDAEKILDKLRKVQQKHPGTFAAEQAGDLADQIRKGMPNLR